MLFSFDLLQNTRYSSLIFSYSTAEYWSRICCRSTWFIYTSMVLNDALRVVTDASLSNGPFTTFFKHPAIRPLTTTCSNDNCFA